MGILETTFDQIADFFGEVPVLHPTRIHRSHLILDFEDEVDGGFKGYRIVGPDSRTIGYADTKAEAREIIDAECDEEAHLEANGPRNREPLTAAEMRREEHGDEAANDRAYGRSIEEIA